MTVDNAISAANHPENDRGLFRGYRFVDYATQSYLTLVGLLLLLFHGPRAPLMPPLISNIPGAHWLILAMLHALNILVIHYLVTMTARGRADRLITFLRHVYPIVLFPALYCETGVLNRMFIPDFLDDKFIAIEERLFGCQPSIELMNTLPFLIVSEIFYLAYLSYYLMIAVIGVVLYCQARRQFFHFLSIISFIFYVCYLIFICVPVAGPPSFWMEQGGYGGETSPFPDAINTGPVFHLMKWIYRIFEAHGAAFPSSHVAIAIATVYFSWRYLPRIRLAHLVLVILLCVSTVYCRYHYVVDVIAGALAAALLIPLGEWLLRRFDPVENQPAPPPRLTPPAARR